MNNDVYLQDSLSLKVLIMLKSYLFAGGNSGNSFTIDESSGQVWTANHLDRETNASYHLKIVVTDNGDIKRSSEAFLNIIITDWNDNNPEFNKTTYQADISEGLAV